MDFLPIFLDVKGRLCLVVGGGEVAKRKAGVLLEAGARVRVVAPQIEPSLTEQRGVESIVARFEVEHLSDVVR
jgi:uroporphyrin-III C-methyltransferase/precorrin-2 dehydrogenase/sirohydrochlorin ferrochelatase